MVEITDQKDLPIALKHEKSVIAASAGVIEDSIRIYSDDTKIAINFMLQTEATVEPPAADIRDNETISLCYNDKNSVGITAPSIWCLRNDFPRNLGHLNPTPLDRPVSLCLARAGHQPIYDRYGIEGILIRLRTWMRDAKTGGLMADGWEPVPYPNDRSIRVGIIDPKAFQGLAYRNGDQVGWATGVARITPPEAGNIVKFYSEEVSATTPERNSRLAQITRLGDTGIGRTKVPWLFVWSNRDAPISEPVFSHWKTYKGMQDSLEPFGLAEKLNAASGAVFANGCDCVHAQEGSKALVIIIGIWRPTPLLENIYGLSEDPLERSLEIKAYTLESDRNHQPILDDTKVRTIIADPWPGKDLYKWVSGVDTTGGIALFGNGALGSAISDHLLRIGIDSIDVLDKDFIAPHNLARHHAFFEDLYSKKVDHLSRAAKKLSVEMESTNVNPIPENIIDLDQNDLRAMLRSSTFLVDASADERVRRYLSGVVKNDERQLTRVELYNDGKLGVQFVCGAHGNPDLLDLYYTLCFMALGIDAVYRWLFNEHVEGLNRNELTFGFGCTSITTRLPNYVVAQHASAFMPTIIAGQRGQIPTGIGLNILDDAFRPCGWQWIDVPNFDVRVPEGGGEWSLHIHPEVLTSLATERDAALPRETGGYLYGGFDLAAKQIVIVAASPLPPGSDSSGVAVSLGEAGATPIEKRLARRTKGRINLCGTWHSHPGESSTRSLKDIATYMGFVGEDSDHGIPTLMLIIANDGIHTYLNA